jgi:rubredoxin
MAKYQCPDCGYIYDEVAGHPHEGFEPGTPWSQVPESWSCPDLAVRDKIDFQMIDGVPLGADAGRQRVAWSAAVPSTTVPWEGSTAVQERPAAPAARDVSQPLPPTQAGVGEEKIPKSVSSAATGYRQWICITCGHIYDEALGDEHEGFAPGTLFNEIPDDWCCPDCGATKEDYVLYEEK